jgi:hypothetical protein
MSTAAKRPYITFACFSSFTDNRSVEGCPVLAAAVHDDAGSVSHGTVTVALQNLSLGLQSSALAAVSTTAI